MSLNCCKEGSFSPVPMLPSVEATWTGGTERSGSVAATLVSSGVKAIGALITSKLGVSAVSAPRSTGGAIKPAIDNPSGLAGGVPKISVQSAVTSLGACYGASRCYEAF